MAITKQDILHVADLARLELTPEESDLYTGQLQRILGHVEKLSMLDTSGIKALSFAAGSMLREDKVSPSLSQDDALRNAPLIAKGCFNVPKIIE